MIHTLPRTILGGLVVALVVGACTQGPGEPQSPAAFQALLEKQS